jgi:hypothetical protein
LVKQVPDIGFALDGNLYKSLTRQFSEELGIWGASESVRMIMIASFGISSAGVPTISRLSLMPVTQQWLPVETVDEQQLVERLIHEGRAFKKILRYDLSRRTKVPSIALTDQGEPTQPVYY